MKKIALYTTVIIGFAGTANAMYRQTNRLSAPLITSARSIRGAGYIPKSCNLKQPQRSFNRPSSGNRQFNQSGRSASWATGLAGAGLVGLGAGYYLGQDKPVLAEEPFYYDREFKLINDSAGTIKGNKWAVKAIETPTEFRIYVKNPGVLFHSWGGQLSFRVTSEGEGIQAVYHEKHNPEEFAFGPTGGFNLPHPAAKELWTTRQKYSYIEPIQISENEIELVIPKDLSFKREASFYNWWNPKEFYIWSDNFRKPGDPLSGPRIS